MYEVNLSSQQSESMIDFTKELYNSFLYECELALFMVDIENEESLASIKTLIEDLKSYNFPDLKKLLIINKMDKETERKISSFELNEFADINKLKSFEISVQEGNGVEDLCKYIDQCVNSAAPLSIPMNLVKECPLKRASGIDFTGALSFILIGDSGVGKTAFLDRYFKNQFSEMFLSTIGIDKEFKYVKVGKENYKMTLWDTAGQEKFKCLPKKYYQNADGVLLLFDVTDRQTFDHVQNWMNDVQQNSTRQLEKDGAADNSITLFLIGNKIDKPGRAVNKEEAEELAKSLGMKYFEASCKINMNIPEIMARMILDCHKKSMGGKEAKSPGGVELNNQTNNVKRQGGCCGGGNNDKKNVKK